MKIKYIDIRLEDAGWCDNKTLRMTVRDDLGNAHRLSHTMEQDDLLSHFDYTFNVLRQAMKEHIEKHYNADPQIRMVK